MEEIDKKLIYVDEVNFLFINNVREATVGCVAADCNPAHQKHRWFDSNRVHQFQRCHRLSVRTNGFQPLERGSTPRGSAIFNSHVAQW